MTTSNENIALYTDYAGRFIIELTDNLNPVGGAPSWTEVYRSSSNEASYDYEVPLKYGTDNKVTAAMRCSMYLADDSTSWTPVAAKMVDQQIVPVVYDGVGEFSVSLISDRSNSVIFDPNLQTYTPNWGTSSTNLHITPTIMFGSDIVPYPDTRIVSKTWTRKLDNGTETPLTTGETVDASSGVLTVNQNKFGENNNSLVYKLSITFTDSSGNSYQASSEITFSLVKNGQEGATLVNMILSNDNETISCDAQGSIPSGFFDDNHVYTIATIYEGSDDVTSQYPNKAVTLNGVSGRWDSSNTNKYIITGWTGTSSAASVIITYSGRSGYAPLTKTMTLNKLSTGSSPTYHELEYSSLVTKRTVSGTTRSYNPSSITFKDKFVDGNSHSYVVGYVLIYKNGDTTSTPIEGTMTGEDIPSYTYTINTGIGWEDLTYLTVKLYSDSGHTAEVDSQNIYVIEDGAKGDSLYTWIAYANTYPVTPASTLSWLPDANTKAMGIVYNKVSQQPSGSAPSLTDFTSWSEIKGAKGDAGTTISSVEIRYAIHSSSTDYSTISSGSWKTAAEIEQTTFEKPYLWTRVVTTYSNGNSYTSFSVGSTIDSIGVGGTNLLLGTNQGTTNFGFNLGDRYSQPEISEAIWLNTRAFQAKIGEIHSSGTSSDKSIYFNDHNIFNVLQPNTTYTLSFDSTVNHSGGFGIQDANGNNNMIGSGPTMSVTQALDELGNSYFHNEGVFTTKPLGGDQGFVRSAQYVYIASNMSYMEIPDTIVKYTNFKLEQGNTATSWSPATGDINKELDNTNDSIDTISNIINNTVTCYAYADDQFGQNFIITPDPNIKSKEEYSHRGMLTNYLDTSINRYFIERNPVGNPSQNNYYEYNSTTGVYTKSSDTTVISSKTYYYQTNYMVDIEDPTSYTWEVNPNWASTMANKYMMEVEDGIKIYSNSPDIYALINSVALNFIADSNSVASFGYSDLFGAYGAITSNIMIHGSGSNIKFDNTSSSRATRGRFTWEVRDNGHLSLKLY